MYHCRSIRAIVCGVLASVLSATPALAAQRPVPPATEAAAFKQMAAAIPLGSRVKLQAKEGRRITATLMAVNDDAVIVQRVSRVPEPPITIPFTDLVRLERESKGGMTIGKAIGIGLAAGAGAIATLFVIMLSVTD